MRAKYAGLHVKCPLFLSDFKQNWNAWANFDQNFGIQNFINILSAVVELLRIGKRTGTWTQRNG
jgi:hypothetical protein